MLIQRNLLFYMYPVASGYWKWHRKQLENRLPLFNGRKVMAVAQGKSLQPIELVAETFPEFELIKVESNPDLREVAAFEDLFSAIEKETGITLFAHSKGVTRSPLSSCKRWTEILYETLCDYPKIVEETLSKYPVAGSFKKIGWAFPESNSNWHYSGSFFWFRNKDFYSRNWKVIDKFWAGIEAYPSLHFAIEEAGTVFMQGVNPTMNLYDWKYINEVVEPELVKFKIENESKKA